MLLSFNTVRDAAGDQARDLTLPLHELMPDLFWRSDLLLLIRVAILLLTILLTTVDPGLAQSAPAPQTPHPCGQSTSSLGANLQPVASRLLAS